MYDLFKLHVVIFVWYAIKLPQNPAALVCIILSTRAGCLPGFSTRKTWCCGLLIQVRIREKQDE